IAGIFLSSADIRSAGVRWYTTFARIFFSRIRRFHTEARVVHCLGSRRSAKRGPPGVMPSTEYQLIQKPPKRQTARVNRFDLDNIADVEIHRRCEIPRDSQRFCSVRALEVTGSSS